MGRGATHAFGLGQTGLDEFGAAQHKQAGGSWKAGRRWASVTGFAQPLGSERSRG